MADMSKQRVIEVIQLIIRRCGHLSQYVRVTADSALTKDNHTAGQNIGTFDSNRDRRTLIVAGQEVGRSEADTFTPRNIHGINNGALSPVGTVVFHNRGQNRRFFSQHNTGSDQCGGGIHQIGISGNPRQRLLNPFHFADRHSELAADIRISTDCHGRTFQPAGGIGRQGDTTPDRQTLHQHAPALSGHSRPADNIIQRHKDIVAARRAVLKRDVEREMAGTGFNPGGIYRDECAGDPERGFFTEQFVRVIQFKGETQYCGDRCQGDIAFIPVQAHAEHLFTLPFAGADNPGIRNGTGI